MHREGDEIHVSTTEAKAGNRGSFLFQILAISLVIIILAFGAVWLVGSGTSVNTGGPVTEATAT
jgi:hypothetical protein